MPITCVGAKPLVESDKQLIDFGRLLLRTKDTQIVALTNKSPLPAAWKVLINIY